MDWTRDAHYQHTPSAFNLHILLLTDLVTLINNILLSSVDYSFPSIQNRFDHTEQKGSTDRYILYSIHTVPSEPIVKTPYRRKMLLAINNNYYYSEIWRPYTPKKGIIEQILNEHNSNKIIITTSLGSQ